jgi:hypothetical protein
VATKERLRRLVDHLPKSEVPAAERYLEYLSVARPDPFLQALMHAPLADEPETEEERAAVAEARAALERGEAISDQELRRDLGRGLRRA